MSRPHTAPSRALWPSLVRRAAAGLVPVLALALTGCGGSSSDAAGAETETGEPFEESPLPTIGLGSDLGAISGSTELRSIDTGEVDSIVMIGDSITVGATPHLEERFAAMGFDDVAISAQNSKRIGMSFGDNASGADIASFVAAAREGDPAHTLWVIALGTNDAGQYDGSDEVATVVDEVLAAVPTEAPVIWIDTYFEDRLDGSEMVNAAIEQQLRERGNATIGRWSVIAPSDGVLVSDGVHTTDGGAVVFADLVATTVADFLQ